MRLTSKMTRKGQTTIPQAVRASLGLKAGDEIAYLIEVGRVALMRAESAHAGSIATFSEWKGEVDTNAYSDL